MKIGFLTAKRAEKEFHEECTAIVEYLQSKGHEVVHMMDMPLESILPLEYAKRQELFMEFYEKLAECDLIVAETSMQSTQVGFGIAYLRMKGKPLIILSQGDAVFPYFPKGEVYSNMDNMMTYKYDKTHLKSVIDEALAYMEPHIDKRFSLIFPSYLLSQVEEKVQKLHMPKSVYIRQLIEKDLQDNTAE